LILVTSFVAREGDDGRRPEFQVLHVQQLTRIPFDNLYVYVHTRAREARGATLAGPAGPGPGEVLDLGQRAARY